MLLRRLHAQPPARTRPGRTWPAWCPGWRSRAARRRGTRPRRPTSRVNCPPPASTVSVPSLDLDELLGARRVGFAPVLVPGGQGPVPQLDHIRWIGAGHQHPAPTGLAAPQDSAVTVAGDLHRPGGPLDQGGQPDAERVADPEQCPHAGVRRALLDVDHHPAADPGHVGQLVQRPAAGLPLLPDPPPDRRRQGCGILIHECMIVHWWCICRTGKRFRCPTNRQIRQAVPRGTRRRP